MALWWKWGTGRGEPWALHCGIMRWLIQEGTSLAWQTSSSFSSQLCCGTCFSLQPLFWLHALKPAPWRGLWKWSQPPFTTHCGHKSQGWKSDSAPFVFPAAISRAVSPSKRRVLVLLTYLQCPGELVWYSCDSSSYIIERQGRRMPIFCFRSAGCRWN